jgi:hypothetical protein
VSKSHNIVHRIKRGSLIEHSLDGIKRESFEVIKRELRNVLEGKMGIYALYKKDKLVRVGLGTKIYFRVKGHSENKKLHWDTVSLFLIKKEMLKYLRDLETAVVRIAKPKYNQQKGRTGDDHYLGKVLKTAVKKKSKKLKIARTKKDKELRGLEQEIKQIREVIKG